VSGESSLNGRKAPTATQDKQSDKVPQTHSQIAHAHTHGMDGVNFRETIERFVCDMVYSRAAYMFLSVGEHTGACKIHTRTHTQCTHNAYQPSHASVLFHQGDSNLTVEHPEVAVVACFQAAPARICHVVSNLRPAAGGHNVPKSVRGSAFCFRAKMCREN
jgi:hypothetical protein